MRQITDTRTITGTGGECANWQRLKDHEINSHFQTFVASTNGDTTGNYGSVQRYLGIDYGVVNNQFHTDVVGAGSGELSLELALHSDEGFKIYFKVNNTYYAADLSLGLTTNSGMVSDPRPSRPHYGISEELKDQLMQNWCMIPFSLVSDLFYTLDTQNSLDRRGSQIYGLNQWERANRYRFFDPNLAALKALIGYNATNDASKIRVLFGVNLSDILLRENIFTLIIEVDNRDYSSATAVQQGIHYLEFVHACPPWCD